MNDIDQLRADLEVVNRYSGFSEWVDDITTYIHNKIAKLEAEADPWRDAKQRISIWRGWDHPEDIIGQHGVVSYVDNLTAELAAKDKRIADLEDAKHAANMVPSFEGPIVGIEPVLDPARVLATAAEAIDVVGYMLGKNTRHNVKVVMRNASMYEKPYRLKGGDGGN